MRCTRAVTVLACLGLGLGVGCAPDPPPAPPASAEPLAPTVSEPQLTAAGGSARVGSSVHLGLSGQGPFVLTLGCAGSGEIALDVGDGVHTVPCGRTGVVVRDVQRVATANGLQFLVVSSSDGAESWWAGVHRKKSRWRGVGLEPHHREDAMTTPLAGDELIARVRELAHTHHADQRDKAGAPYTGHLARVAGHAARRVAEAGPDVDPGHVVTAAWLHDIVEDTDVSLDDLAALGVPAPVRDAVALVTRRADVPADRYYAAIRTHPIARLVKLADLDDNSDPQRLALLDADTRERLTRKYATAREQLGVDGS